MSKIYATQQDAALHSMTQYGKPIEPPAIFRMSKPSL